MGLPEPRAETTIGWISAIFAITTTFFSVRVYYEFRRWRAGSLTIGRHVSFYLAAGAWVCLAATYGLLMWTLDIIIKERHAYTGVDALLHQMGVTIYLKTLPKYMKVLFSSVVLLSSGIWLVKASFIIMYFEISSRISRSLRWTLYVAASYILLSYLVFFVSLFIWCDSFSDVFRMDKYLMQMSQYCNPINYVNSTSNLNLYTVMNTTSDFVVMLVPLLILRTIQITKREKWAVVFLLALGALTMTTTIVRTKLMASSSSWGKSRFQTGEILAFAECAAAVIAVSLPSMRAAWNTHHRQQLSHKKSSGNVYSSSGTGGRTSGTPMFVRDLSDAEYAQYYEMQEPGRTGRRGPPPHVVAPVGIMGPVVGDVDVEPGTPMLWDRMHEITSDGPRRNVIHP